jgi:DNA-binding LacI/PurR family transcriptional regulator
MDPQDIIDSISHDSCPPTGLFVFSDETALQLINIASNKGWDIPSRLSFIGFDDLPSFCTFSDKLTTIHQDIFRKAETSCNILFEHIATPDKPSENITLDVRLVERNSVCRLS